MVTCRPRGDRSTVPSCSSSSLSRFVHPAPSAEVDTLSINGALSGRIIQDGALSTVISFVVEGGRISRLYAVRNPHTLRSRGQVAVLAR